MLNDFLDAVKVHIVFSEEEVAHFMLPRENVIYSYVVESYANNVTTVTDFYSFYALPSSILQHLDYDTLRVAYSWYNVSTTDRLDQGMKDLLVLAK